MQPDVVAEDWSEAEGCLEPWDEAHHRQSSQHDGANPPEEAGRRQTYRCNHP